MKGIVFDVEGRKSCNTPSSSQAETGESFFTVPLLKVGLNVDKIFDFKDGDHINGIVAAEKNPRDDEGAESSLSQSRFEQ